MFHILLVIREDTMVVESFSRLSRSAKDLLLLVESMHANGIAFGSLKEKVDTSTDLGKLFLTIIAALSEFEREVVLERQSKRRCYYEMEEMLVDAGV